MTHRAPGTPGRGLLAEAKDAVTPRAFLLVCGVGLLQLAFIVFVIVGNPSAGGAYGWPLLPTFWAAVGPWLPPGAATDAIRGAVYFGNAGITRDLLVLGGYALAGLVVSYLVLMLAGRRPGGLPVRVADRTQSAGLGSGDT